MLKKEHYILSHENDIVQMPFPPIQQISRRQFVKNLLKKTGISVITEGQLLNKIENIVAKRILLDKFS